MLEELVVLILFNLIAFIKDPEAYQQFYERMFQQLKEDYEKLKVLYWKVIFVIQAIWRVILIIFDFIIKILRFIKKVLDYINKLNDQIKQSQLNQNRQQRNLSLKYDELVDKVYDLEWLDEQHDYPDDLKKFIKENLQCQICLQLMKKAVELSCQHIMCEQCSIKNELRQIFQIKCPFCMKNCHRVIQQTRRAKLLTHLANTIDLQCFQCIFEAKSLKNQNLYNSVLDVWYGNVSEIKEHLPTHSKFGRTVSDSYCRNRKFGCTYIFYQRYQKILHENAQCEYQWIRCCRCMNILSLKNLHHRCDSADFLNKINVAPNYKFSKQVLEEYQLCIRLPDHVNTKVLESQFLCYKEEQGSQYYMFYFDNLFIKDNFKNTLASLGYNSTEIQQWTNKIQQVIQKDTFKIIQQQKYSEIQEYKYQRPQQKSERPQYCYIEEQKYDQLMIHQESDRWEKQNQVQYAQNDKISSRYKKATLYVNAIRAEDAESADEIIREKLSNPYGQIVNVQIKGIGQTGKYYGVVKYSTDEGAQYIVDQCNIKGSFKSGKFQCFVKKMMGHTQRRHQFED